MLGAPAQAALEPAVRALGRARRVVARDVEGRALVEGEHDVGVQLRLHRHRDLGAEEALGAVDVGAKAHALLLDRDDRALAGAAAAALDLIGDGAVPHREDLEAAGVGDDRVLPAHEAVEAAEALDQLAAGAQEEVEGVAEHHPVAERGDLAGPQPAHAAAGRERHERGRRDLPVRGLDDAGARERVAVTGDDAHRGIVWMRRLGLRDRRAREHLQRRPEPRLPAAGGVRGHRVAGRAGARRDGGDLRRPRRRLAGGCRSCS